MGLHDLVYSAYERRLARGLARSGAAVPRHVGVILDGNRRWARSMGASSADGTGVRCVLTAGQLQDFLDAVVAACAEVGVVYDGSDDATRLRRPVG